MPTRPKTSTDNILDLFIGRSLLSAETLRQELIEKLALDISFIGMLDENAIVAEARKMLARWQPILAQHLTNATILTWIGGYAEEAAHLPPHVAEIMRNVHAWRPIDVPTLPGLLDLGDASPPAVRFPRIEKAAESLFRRSLLTRPQYDLLTANARQAAFTVAYVDDTAVIGKIRDALAESAREGATLPGFRAKVLEKLGESPIGPSHLENVYRTGLMSAFRDGKESLAQNPIVQEIFRYRRFVATHDGRVRDDHLAFETFGLEGGPIYRTDDPVWDIASPPLGYQCRCSTTLLRVADAARYGVKEAQETLRTGRPPANPEYCIDKVTWRPPQGFGVRHGPLLAVS